MLPVILTSRCDARRVLKLIGFATLLLLCAIVLLNYERVSRWSSTRVSPVRSRLENTATASQSQAPIKNPASSKLWQPTGHDRVSANWTFIPERDAERYGLNEEECKAAFPRFDQEVDRARKYWEVKRIRPSDLDVGWREDGIVRAMIYNRRLYILDHEFSGAGYNIHRAIAVLAQIHRAIESYAGHIPNVEFSFAVSDIADPKKESKERPIWTFSRRAEDVHQWLIPDFGFWSWGLDLVGEYSQIREQMLRYEMPLADKVNRLVWRGAENSDIRSQLLKVTEPYRSSWADVWPVSWSGRTKLSSGSTQVALSIPEHCNWRLLMHTEGVSYSGRGKYLLNCHSVVIAHELEWIENWHHLLASEGPKQNYVKVKRDLSDLSNKVEHLLAFPEEAERIANNSIATFRNQYLTPAAQACYWRALLRAWKVVSFEPELYEVMNKTDEAGEVISSILRIRGTPYETFIITAFDDLNSRCKWYGRLVGSC